MARAESVVQLTDELIAALDRRARRDGVSRSRVIRDAVEAYLASDRAAAIDEQVVEGYRRMPQGGEFDVDEWGDLGKFVTVLAAEMLRRVDQEERQAGFEPW